MGHGDVARQVLDPDTLTPGNAFPVRMPALYTCRFRGRSTDPGHGSPPVGPSLDTPPRQLARQQHHGNQIGSPMNS